ncbi:MAG: hypothetical protein HYR66_11165 [Sphingobacteriales bacterium]|nr:hypothetical protein [Sphingobacteriales bacterium]MBI3720752.1 hypothetical protein [Sphingobacteriales bacterium]
MKFFVGIFSLLISFNLAAQDYFPDFRRKNESLLKVGEKDVRADIVTFSLKGVEENIHQEKLPKLPVTAYDQLSIQYEGTNIPYMLVTSNTIKVKVTTDFFDSTKRKIMKSSGHVVKINNRPFYGSYGVMPVTYVKEVLVMINKDTIAIPPSAYNDLFNMKFAYTDKQGVERTQSGVFLSADRRKIYIYIFCKDDKGSYEVTWVIQDKQYLRRVLDYDVLQ